MSESPITPSPLTSASFPTVVVSFSADDLAAADELRADLGWNQTILEWQLHALSYLQFQVWGTSARGITLILALRG